MEQTRSEVRHGPPVQPGDASDAPAKFEEAYLLYAPLLRKIAMAKFGIPLADAEPLVHDVFATYFTNAGEVNDVRTYLIGGICNAARHHLRRTDAKNALFCGETPCAAAPTESILAARSRGRSPGARSARRPTTFSASVRRSFWAWVTRTRGSRRCRRLLMNR